MRNSSRLSSCTSCRKLKRKCDVTKVGSGPCSNCRMRNMGHLCSFVQPAKLPFTKVGSLESTNGDAVSDNEEKMTDLLVTTTSNLPAKFISACIFRFFTATEMSFYLEPEPLVNALIDLNTTDPDKDVATISLLYILCALVIIRNGAFVSPASKYKGTRETLAADLLASHYKITETLPRNCQSTCRLYLMRSLYYIHLYFAHHEAIQEAWASFITAMECFNATPLPTTTREWQIHNKLIVALGYAEQSLCYYVQRPHVLSLQLSHRIDSDGFAMQRRWSTLKFMRRIQETMEQNPEDLTPEEVGILEHEVVNYISVIDTIEGRTGPYGQLLLFVAIIKLRTCLLLRDVKTTGTMSEEVSESLSALEDHTTNFTECLEVVLKFWYSGPGTSMSFLGSSQMLAVSVFQAITCVWMIERLTKGTSVDPDFEMVRVRLWGCIKRVRVDVARCRVTQVLMDALEMLKAAEVDGVAPDLPEPLQKGMSAISDLWASSRPQGNPVVNMQSNPDIFAILEDPSIWTYMSAQNPMDSDLIVLPDLATELELM